LSIKLNDVTIQLNKKSDSFYTLFGRGDSNKALKMFNKIIASKVYTDYCEDDVSWHKKSVKKTKFRMKLRFFKVGGSSEKVSKKKSHND